MPQTLGMGNVAGWSQTEQSPKEEDAGREMRHSSPLSQVSPPVPSLGMALGFREMTSKPSPLQKHKRSSSWHTAARLIQETDKSTCSPVLVPGESVGTVPPCKDVSWCLTGSLHPPSIPGSHAPADPEFLTLPTSHRNHGEP